MIVTRIEEISKSKVRVTLDSEFSLVIYKGELKKYHITENEEFPQNQYELLLTVLEKRAKLRCMNLLKSRDYTVYQLKTKLKENGYPEFLIDTAIEYVASYGYVDDERYTRAYIESVSGTKSRNQIMNDLVRKGLDRQHIAEAYEEIMAEHNEDPKEDLIRRYIVKKHYDAATATYEEKQKLIAFLYRKGFGLDKIYKIVDENK